MQKKINWIKNPTVKRMLGPKKQFKISQVVKEQGIASYYGLTKVDVVVSYLWIVNPANANRIRNTI